MTPKQSKRCMWEHVMMVIPKWLGMLPPVHMYA